MALPAKLRNVARRFCGIQVFIAVTTLVTENSATMSGVFEVLLQIVRLVQTKYGLALWTKVRSGRANALDAIENMTADARLAVFRVLIIVIILVFLLLRLWHEHCAKLGLQESSMQISGWKSSPNWVNRNLFCVFLTTQSRRIVANYCWRSIFPGFCAHLRKQK